MFGNKHSVPSKDHISYDSWAEFNNAPLKKDYNLMREQGVPEDVVDRLFDVYIEEFQMFADRIHKLATI